jgi:rRNA-processing protein FCF1
LLNENFENIKSVLIDTNLLILYLTGRYNEKLIAKSKRLSNYTSEDFFILKKYLQKFKQFITTPHILTETSNLLSSGVTKKDPFVWETIKNALQGFEEIYVKKNFLFSLDFLSEFGITDSAIIQIAREKKVMILTDDTNLWGRLRKMQLPYENFNNLRGKNYFQK